MLRLQVRNPETDILNQQDGALRGVGAHCAGLAGPQSNIALATVRKDVAPSPLRYRGTPQGAVTPITQE